ncbi:MAG: branched-chain amino acid ABC transporter permease [Dehalococcoidia bacterium]
MPLLANLRRVRLGAAALAVLILAIFPWVASSAYQQHIASFIFLYITLASSWNIIGGYTGYVSLGHAFFFGVGAYTVAILLRDFPVLIALSEFSPFGLALLAGVVAAAFGLVIGWIALRIRGPAFVIVTITLLLTGSLVAHNIEFTGGSYGITLPLPSWGKEFFTIPFYYALLILAGVTVWASYRIRHSRFGMGLIAIREDEGKAAMVGIDTTLYKVLAFTISAIFVGTAGGIWVYSRSYIDPDGFINLTISGNMIIMTLLGGRGTLWGPVIGATILTLVNQIILANYGTSELNRAILGLVLLAVVVIYPEGIMGLLTKGRDMVVERLGQRAPATTVERRPVPLESIQELED